MINLEEQLNKLPKGRLRLKADLKIKSGLYILIWQKRLAFLLMPKYRLVYGAAMAVFCLTIIVPAYAYSSPAVNSSSWLYPVKQAIENLEIKMAAEPAAKVNVLEKLADRRLAEAENLSKKNAGETGHLIKSTINEALNLNALADDELVKLPVASNTENYTAVKNNYKKNFTARLSNTAANVGIKADDELLDNISLALDRFSAQAKNNAGKAQEKFSNYFPEASSTNAQEAINNEKIEKADDEDIVNKNNSRDNRAIGQKRNFTEKEAADELKNTEQNISLLKTKINKKDYTPEEVDVLFDKLDKKIEKAEEALKTGDLQKTADLIESTESLTNNAEHFIKSNNRGNSGINREKDKSLKATSSVYDINQKENSNRNRRFKVKNQHN